MPQQNIYQEPSLKENPDTFNDFFWDNNSTIERYYFSEPTDLSLSNLLLRETDRKRQFIDKMFPEIFSLLLLSMLLTMSCVKERFQGFDKNNIVFSSNGFSVKESSLTRVF